MRGTVILHSWNHSRVSFTSIIFQLNAPVDLDHAHDDEVGLGLFVVGCACFLSLDLIEDRRKERLAIAQPRTLR